MIFFRMRRVWLLQKFKGTELRLGLGAKLENSRVGNRVFVGANTVLINSSMGDHSYINANSLLKFTTVGKFCSIGPGVKIGLGNHPLDLVSTHPAFYSNNKPFTTFADTMYFEEYQPVIIGNDVWIGEDVMIPGGVTIGDGAAIAARAVVTKDVDPYAFVGGVPAKLIKYRFTEEIRSALLRIKWWNKDSGWLNANFKHFHDPKKFIEFCQRDASNSESVQ